ARDSASTSPRASSAAAPRPCSGSGAANARAVCAPETSGKARAPSSAASRSALKSVIRAARDLNSATDRCRAFIGQPKLSRRVPGYYTRRWFMMYRAMIDPAIGALLAGAFTLLFIAAALQKPRSVARREAAAVADTGDDGGGCRHARCRDGGGRTLIYEC